MPGPGKKKQKQKPKPVSPVVSGGPKKNDPSEFVHRIDNLEGWNVIVSNLCDEFNLPDMNSRSGLKKIHTNFQGIYRELSKAYTDNPTNEKITGGIVGIWAKMCVDSILRDKLFREGLVSKILPLLDVRATRYVGLEALSAVTHHGGMEARRAIAKETTSTLIRLMQELPDDYKANDLIIATLTHAVGAVVNEEHVDTKLLKSLDIPTILPLLMGNMRKPEVPFTLLTHAYYFLTSITRQCHQEVKAIPRLVSLLVSALRTNDLSVRCDTLASLIRLNAADAEMDLRYHDPQKLMDAVSSPFPEHLSNLLVDHGPYNCKTTLILQCAGQYQRAMMRCAQDHDLYSLGRVLGELITKTEFAISEGGFQALNKRTGKLEVMDVGLPFKMWTDALPLCAKALRKNGSRSDLDMADILDIKFHIFRQRIPDAMQHAKKAIERNPNVAYYYYAIGLGANHEQALRAVKKGLKAKQTTPFVRLYSLWRAVEHAGDMGVTMLTSARTGEQDYIQGVAFLMSALEDAKSFVAEASPDTRHLHTILNWYIILTLAIRGPELSEDLRELDAAFKKLDITHQFAEFLGHPFKETQMRLTQEMIVRHYPSAAKEFAPDIARFDALFAAEDNGAELRAAIRADDTLEAWLDNLHIDEDGHDHGHRNRVKVSRNAVALYRCTWCGNPSAVLKKCGGCAKTRYCDTSCQKLHWTEHKAFCKTQADSTES